MEIPIIQNWYCEPTLSEQDKNRLEQKLTGPVFNWFQREYTPLRRRVEKCADAKSACKITDGKIPGEEGLSWLALMICIRDEKQTEGHIFVGSHEYVRVKLEAIAAHLFRSNAIIDEKVK